MREYEFRGKCIENGRWVFGYYGAFEDSHFIQEPNDIISRKVTPETVGQYTGLKDKNGVKIFEGDIVETYKGRMVIVWVKSEAKFAVHDFEDDEEYAYSLTDTIQKDIEIIGNIHDNPELLNAEREGAE